MQEITLLFAAADGLDDANSLEAISTPAYVRVMTWYGFNWVDAAVLLLLIGGVVGGMRRGLSGELARVLIAAGCIAVVYRFSRPVADWLGTRYGTEPHLSHLASLVLLLLASYLGLTLVRIVLAALFSFSFKGRTERIGGGICGLLRSGFVVVLLLLLLSLLPHESIQRWVTEESRVGRWVTARAYPWYQRLAEQVPELRLPEKKALELKEKASENAAELWEEVPLGPVN